MAISFHNIKLVIFDLDGTLVNTAPDLINACAHAFEKYQGHPLDQIFKDQLIPLAGDGARALLKKSFQLTAQTYPGDDAEMVADFLIFYHRHIRDHSEIYDGVDGLLKQLSGKQITMAVLTNKPERLAVKLLDELYLSDYFQLIYGGDRFEKSKPNPMGILALLDQLNIPPDQTILIGDSQADFLAAKAADVAFLGVEQGYSSTPLDEFNPQYLFRSIVELAQFLKQQTFLS